MSLAPLRFWLITAAATLVLVGASDRALARVHDGVLLLIDEPRLLKAVESSGFSASQLIEDPDYVATGNSDWALRPGFKSIVESLSADLDQVKTSDRKLGVTMASSHRLFDQGWFRSPDAKFELVGIVNRLDRGSFYRSTGRDGTSETCGEIRFIYRLSYRKTVSGQMIYTRLPMTLNVVYLAQGQPCAKIASRWLVSRDPRQEDLSSLLQGPLERSQFPQSRLKSVEINLQSVRWPSTTRPDLGGHAEYLLRVFAKTRGTRRFELQPLENTPDVKRLRAEPVLLTRLRSRLKDPAVLAAFDEGTATLPSEFLTKRATSIAFHGMNRLSNRPFEQVVSAADLPTAAKYAENAFIRSPNGYLRRLNDMSCIGCHQSRSIAGFHFLGVDSDETLAANSIKVSHSAHLVADLPRRAAFVKAIASGALPSPARPFSERDPSNAGGYGDHCSLRDDPSFNAWGCGTDLECRADNTPSRGALIGTCLPKAGIKAGDPCDTGVITQSENSRNDRVTAHRRVACGPAKSCLKAWEGFPGGICFGSCDALGEDESCGMIAVGGFNECLFANRPFTECLQKHTGPISMRACDESRPCRDDYICAGKRQAQGAGACIPPYFLFQLRLDGHPRP